MTTLEWNLRITTVGRRRDRVILMNRGHVAGNCMPSLPLAKGMTSKNPFHGARVMDGTFLITMSIKLRTVL
jgi:hypothetical protein